MALARPLDPLWGLGIVGPPLGPRRRLRNRRLTLVDRSQHQTRLHRTLERGCAFVQRRGLKHRLQYWVRGSADGWHRRQHQLDLHVQRVVRLLHRPYSHLWWGRKGLAGLGPKIYKIFWTLFSFQFLDTRVQTR